MKISQHLDDKLVDYLDGKLTGTERQTLEIQLNHDSDLAARLNELKSMDTLMKGVPLQQPSSSFTARLLNRLDEAPAYRSPSLRNGLWLLAGVLITIGVAAALIASGAFDNSATTIDLNQINVGKKYFNKTLPSFMLDSKLLVNTIIVLNLAIVFVVLDRVILKPYFQRRMQSSH